MSLSRFSAPQWPTRCWTASASDVECRNLARLAQEPAVQACVDSTPAAKIDPVTAFRAMVLLIRMKRRFGVASGLQPPNPAVLVQFRGWFMPEMPAFRLADPGVGAPERIDDRVLTVSVGEACRGDAECTRLRWLRS